MIFDFFKALLTLGMNVLVFSIDMNSPQLVYPKWAATNLLTNFLSNPLQFLSASAAPLVKK